MVSGTNHTPLRRVFLRLVSICFLFIFCLGETKPDDLMSGRYHFAEDGSENVSIETPILEGRKIKASYSEMRATAWQVKFLTERKDEIKNWASPLRVAKGGGADLTLEDVVQYVRERFQTEVTVKAVSIFFDRVLNWKYDDGIGGWFQEKRSQPHVLSHRYFFFFFSVFPYLSLLTEKVCPVMSYIEDNKHLFALIVHDESPFRANMRSARFWQDKDSSRSGSNHDPSLAPGVGMVLNLYL